MICIEDYTRVKINLLCYLTHKEKLASDGTEDLKEIVLLMEKKTPTGKKWDVSNKSNPPSLIPK